MEEKLTREKILEWYAEGERDLRNTDEVKGIDLSNTNLEGMYFKNLNFYGANFSHLEGTIFNNADFYNVGMSYKNYKSLPDNLKMKVWNDDYNARLNTLGYFLHSIVASRSANEEKYLEYMNRKEGIDVAIFENGKAQISTYRKCGNIKYNDLSIEKMFEILENEIGHKRCEKDLIEEQNKEENKELFLKMNDILKEIEDETYYVRFKIPINEFLKMFKDAFCVNLKLQKGVEIGFIELSKAVNIRTQEVVGYIWTYAVPGSYKGSHEDVGQEDAISISCMKLKLLNLLKQSYEYEIGYW